MMENRKNPYTLYKYYYGDNSFPFIINKHDQKLLGEWGGGEGGVSNQSLFRSVLNLLNFFSGFWANVLNSFSCFHIKILNWN